MLIRQYLIDHPHITVLSDVCYSTMRNGTRNTNYRSGDRYVLVESGFSPSLPENTQIGEYNVRVWHRSQEVFCKRCNTANMHKTGDITECENYRADTGHVVAFKDDWNILSNYFICKVSVFGKIFRSAEHAYQWKKCMDCLKEDLAELIMSAPTPQKAKQIALRIDDRSLATWKKANGQVVVMSQVLMGKAKSNIDFASALLKTEDKLIVEATTDNMWGCGLPPPLAVTVRNFPGYNLCGRLLMELRTELSTQHAVAPPSPPLLTAASLHHTCSSPAFTEPSSPATETQNHSDSPPVIEQHENPQPPSTTTTPIKPSTSPNPPVTPLMMCSTVSLNKKGSNVPPQSPLIGKLLARRLMRPRRLMARKENSDDESDCDMASEIDYGWPNWDRDSIASEITNVDDCDIVFE